MINFSDTSYLARICYIPFILIWMVIRIWQTSRWESFSFLRLIRLEPRPLFTYTFFLALLVHFVHDIILYFIKFNEGYIIKPVIAEKPESDWSTKNLQLNYISNYLDSISISFTITSLFALQIFWCHTMEQMSKKQYIGIWEYWIYLVLAILLLPIFPVITYLAGVLIENPKYQENLPRLSASGIALLLCFVGGLRVHSGIDELLNLKSRIISQNQGKLKYFQDLNIWLNFAIFIWSASYLIISMDGILSVIITTRFISDLLIVNVNFGELIFYICIISIFNPDFSIKQKQRVISTPLDVSRTSSVLGPDGQIIVETSQNVKIERAFVNPSYRPFSPTPPITPISSKHISMDLLTPMPSPSSAFADGLNNRNQHRTSPLQQSWQQQGQSISDVSSQQTSYNDQAILTEHVGRFGVTQVDDESLQHEEILNEPPIYVENINNNNYNNMHHNNPIKRTPSQNNTIHKDMSLRDSRSNSV